MSAKKQTKKREHHSKQHLKDTWYGDFTELYPADDGTQGKTKLQYRTKTTKAGDYIECDLYPAIETNMDIERNRKQRRMLEKVRRCKMKNKVKYLGHLLNANFGENDYIVTLTTSQPASAEEARKNARNFIVRLQRRAKKDGHELHYLYIIESTGKEDRQRWHIHMVTDGGWIRREDIEDIWKKGKNSGLVRTDRVQEQAKGLEGFAVYITQRKETQEKLMTHAWAASTNLKKPEVHVSKSRFNGKAVKAVLDDVETNAQAYFEKAYPGYELVERPEVRYSDFLPGAYITAWMRKKGTQKRGWRDRK